VEGIPEGQYAGKGNSVNGRFCDLHLHTKWSDGTLSVAATARRAREAGLVAIAITDHDTVGPELVAPRQELEGLEVICGVEIKALVAGSGGRSWATSFAPDTRPSRGCSPGCRRRAGRGCGRWCAGAGSGWACP